MRNMITQNPQVQFIEECKSRIILLIKELLEKKHLYQSVKLTIDDLLVKPFPPTSQIEQELLRNMALTDLNGPWTVMGPRNIDYSLGGGSRDSLRPRLALQVPAIKIYCRERGRVGT